MSLLNKIKNIDIKNIDISPCSVYSAKQMVLTGYDVAYSKELSSLVQQQQEAATKSTDAGNKMKLVTDTINSLNLEIPKLKAQFQPLEQEQVAAVAQREKTIKDMATAQNAIASLQSSLAPLQDEQRKLVAARTVAEGAKATLVNAQATEKTEKEKLEKKLLELQGELAKLKVPIRPKKDVEKELLDKQANLKKLDETIASETAKMNKLAAGWKDASERIKLSTGIATMNKTKIVAAADIARLSLDLLAYGPIEQKTNDITKVKSQIDEKTKLIAEFNDKIYAPDPKTNSINDAINVNANKRAGINAEIAKQNKLVDEIVAKQKASTAKLADIDAKMQNVNKLIQQTQDQITGKIADQVKLKTANDGNSSFNTQFAKTKSDIDNKIALNKEAIVKVLKDKADCENKTSICGASKKEINDLKALLQQYEGELSALNAQYAKCNAAYENKCSAAQLGAQTTLIAGRKTIEDSLKTNYTDYDTKCKGKMDCDGLFSTFQEKKAIYKVANEKKNALKLEHEICLDPTRNGCKDIYSAANINKATTGVNIDTLKRPEGFIQFSDTDNADVTHSRLLSNYESVQNDYTKLKQNIQDLNNANNNDNTKTAKYASKKQLYDNAIYTNILLTALTTSVLYYVFVEI